MKGQKMRIEFGKGNKERAKFNNYDKGCHNCGNLNHIARDCPEKRNYNN